MQSSRGLSSLLCAIGVFSVFEAKAETFTVRAQIICGDCPCPKMKVVARDADPGKDDHCGTGYTDTAGRVVFTGRCNDPWGAGRPDVYLKIFAQSAENFQIKDWNGGGHVYAWVTSKKAGRSGASLDWGLRTVGGEGSSLASRRAAQSYMQLTELHELVRTLTGHEPKTKFGIMFNSPAANPQADLNTIYLPSSNDEWERSMVTAAHEYGHVLHAQYHDGSKEAYRERHSRPDYERGRSAAGMHRPHIRSSHEFALSEGWADFVSIFVAYHTYTYGEYEDIVSMYTSLDYEGNVTGFFKAFYHGVEEGLRGFVSDEITTINLSDPILAEATWVESASLRTRYWTGFPFLKPSGAIEVLGHDPKDPDGRSMQYWLPSAATLFDLFLVQADGLYTLEDMWSRVFAPWCARGLEGDPPSFCGSWEFGRLAAQRYDLEPAVR